MMSDDRIYTVQEQVDLLNDGVEAWNKCRQENPALRFSLFMVNLEDRDLSGINLTNGYIKDCSFQRAVLIGADLSGTRVTRGNFEKANLSSSILVNCGLYDSSCEDADLSNVTAHDAAFVKTAFLSANMTSIDLRNSGIHSCDLQLASLIHGDLAGASFLDSCLRDCDLRWCNFTNTHLSEANLQRALLENAIFYDTSLPDVLPGSLIAWERVANTSDPKTRGRIFSFFVRNAKELITENLIDDARPYWIIALRLAAAFPDELSRSTEFLCKVLTDYRVKGWSKPPGYV